MAAPRPRLLLALPAALALLAAPAIAGASPKKHAAAPATVAPAPTAQAPSAFLIGQQQRRLELATAVRRLDARTELLTEQYDHAVWQLAVAKRRLEDATRRLAAAEAQLEHDQGVLAGLLVDAYRRGESGTVELVLGADSLAQVTSSLDVQSRFDAQLAAAVAAVHRTRDRVRHEKAVLTALEAQREAERRAIAARRAEVEAQLAERRRLLAGARRDLSVAAPADRIGEGQLAVEAARRIRADRRRNAADPGAVLRDDVALDGLEQIGVPYVWGGASPAGFDCSGLVMWLYAQRGVALPHFAAAQYELGPAVDVSQLAPGDLVFFHDLGHVGIYLGGGEVLHAPHTGATVEIAPFDMDWFQQTYVGATRPGPA